jgi:putative flippase GtrA
MNKIDTAIAMAIGAVAAWYFHGLLNEESASGKLGIIGQWLWLLFAVFPIMAAFGLWIASLVGKKYPYIYQLAKFLLAGTACAILDLGLLALFINASGITGGAGYNIFKGISFAIATSLKYFPDKLWAFRDKNKENLKKEFGKFFAITLAGMGANVLIADLIVNQIGPQFSLSDRLWANLGGIAAVLAVFAFNFIGYKFIVFKK